MNFGQFHDYWLWPWNFLLPLTFHLLFISALSAFLPFLTEHENIISCYFICFFSFLRCCKHKSHWTKPRAHINVRIDSGAHKPLIWSLFMWDKAWIKAHLVNHHFLLSVNTAESRDTCLHPSVSVSSASSCSLGSSASDWPLYLPPSLGRTTWIFGI